MSKKPDRDSYFCVSVFREGNHLVNSATDVDKTIKGTNYESVLFPNFVFMLFFLVLVLLVQ